jgi:hypothetical protein
MSVRNKRKQFATLRKSSSKKEPIRVRDEPAPVLLAEMVAAFI